MKQEKAIQKQETKEGREIERASDNPVYAPAVDILENKESFVLFADMPGVDANSVDITVEKKTLEIHGRVEDLKFDDYTLRHSEFGVGDYYRSFTLPDEIDEDKIEATVKDGVLRLELPKKEPERKKIVVKAS